MLTEEQISSNYVRFLGMLEKRFNIDIVKFVEVFGEDNLKYAPAAPNEDSNLAYKGALLHHILFRVTNYAVKFNKFISEEMKLESMAVNEDSLIKVCLLHQIAKCLMFDENDSNWEKTNRGIAYKYRELEGALRCGERSALLCLNNGLTTFTPEEFEAMCIMDRSADDSYSKFYSSSLSTYIRWANELSMNVLKGQKKNNNKKAE